MNESTLRAQRMLGQLNSVLLPAAHRMLDFKISHYDITVDPARPEYNEHVIFVLWHEYISVVLPRWSWTPLTLLVSHHRDGEWLNQTAERLGFTMVRGSSSRGGSRAIRSLRRHRDETSLVITPDGPRGPRREMAMGPVYIASLLKMPIVPVGIGIDRPWRLKTWDRFAIPRPFSRVRLIFGPKIRIPAKQDRARLEATRDSIQQLTTSLTVEAEEWAATGKPMAGQRSFFRAGRRPRLRFPAEQSRRQRLFASEPAARQEDDPPARKWCPIDSRAVAS